MAPASQPRWAQDDPSRVRARFALELTVETWGGKAFSQHGRRRRTFRSLLQGRVRTAVATSKMGSGLFVDEERGCGCFSAEGDAAPSAACRSSTLHALHATKIGFFFFAEEETFFSCLS